MPGVVRLHGNRVTVLAAGVVTSVGSDIESFWSALLAGVDGLTPIERFPVHDLRVGRAGEIKKLPLSTEGLPACRASQLLVCAAEDLRRRATLDCDRTRLGVVVGTALGGVEQ